MWTKTLNYNRKTKIMKTAKEFLEQDESGVHSEQDILKAMIGFADEFAISFSEWVNNIRTYKSKIYCLNSYEELLEMYRIEKGLKQQE